MYTQIFDGFDLKLELEVLVSSPKKKNSFEFEAYIIINLKNLSPFHYNIKNKGTDFGIFKVISKILRS